MSLDTAFTPQLEVGNTTEHISHTEAREAFQRNTDWWTVFASFGLPDFNPSPLWISKKTGIAVEEVVEALEGLAVLGHLRKENGAFFQIEGKEMYSFSFDGKTKAQVIDEHAVVAQQILNDMSLESTFAIDHGFIAGNKEIITDLYNDIKAAVDKAFNRSQKSQQANDGIYKISFSAVDVIKQNSSKEKGVQQ